MIKEVIKTDQGLELAINYSNSPLKQGDIYSWHGKEFQFVSASTNDKDIIVSIIKEII